MQLVTQPISRAELADIAQKGFGNFVKAVVDVKKEVMVIDASLHADQEAYLLKHGSDQSDLWGVNLYPDLEGEDFVEFDSMINLRPSRGNISRGIDDPQIKSDILKVVSCLIK